MAHDAERGCSEDEQDSLLGDRGPLPPLGPVGRFRWVCGASAGLPAGPLDATPNRPGAEPVDRLSAAEPVDPPGAARPAAARTGARPAGPTAADDQVGMARPGQPGEGAVLASDAGGAEHAATEPGRLADRSRLIPRPRPGEPDGDDQGRPAGDERGRPDPDDRGRPDGDERGRPAGATSGPGEPGAAPGTPPEPASQRTPGCQTDLPGWAGAHRHGAVRPSRRSVRRDRPPRRWC
ncbi:hypothetical protein [Plantactinospora sp. BB1]|uniref:hypothetical protein n=1 Tax=Plantactinospora sp. BB1 TaxID=2071627 RepID=UPI00131EFCD0|nr:hypothetical protein [Plantactinospora sp. BB1]